MPEGSWERGHAGGCGVVMLGRRRRGDGGARRWRCGSYGGAG